MVPTGTLDITQFRDDLEQKRTPIGKQTYEIDVNITDQVVIIIDDVLYTGRTVRASLDAVLQYVIIKYRCEVKIYVRIVY